jgi:hypothetical protein
MGNINKERVRSSFNAPSSKQACVYVFTYDQWKNLYEIEKNFRLAFINYYYKLILI